MVYFHHKDDIWQHQDSKWNRIYLSGLASMCKLVRKSITTSVSKYLNENMFSSWNKQRNIAVRNVIRKLISLPPNTPLEFFEHSQLYMNIFKYWSTVSLTRFCVLISRKKAGFNETILYQGVKLVDQSFRARKVLPFIYSVALPWSSMSHFHCWCWCHFSNALMGKGICMTPPPPPLTTNSSFNTSTKFSDLFVTQFLNLVHFHSSFWIIRLSLWGLCVWYETLCETNLLIGQDISN